MARPKAEDHLLQKRLEARDQVIDKLSKLMESWEKRLTVKNLRLNERFRAGELIVLLHFRPKDSLEGWVLAYQPVFPIESDALQQVVMADGDKKMMFVNTVELVELPERVIPTLIRF